MMMVRTPRYWEQVRDEMADIFEAHAPIAQLGSDRSFTKTWEAVRKEAIEKLYVNGVFHDIGQWKGDA
jgi:hypothetical protein